MLKRSPSFDFVVDVDASASSSWCRPAVAESAEDDDGDLHSDVCGHAMSRRSMRLKVPKGYSDGPSSLEGCLDWCPLALRTIDWHDKCHGTRFADEIASKLSQTIVLTSTYSGTGMPEAAAGPCW
jgi:hypothetical protein